MILLRAALRRTGTIETIKRLDASLEYAVMHGDEKEAERIREELRKLTDEVLRQMAFEERGSVVQFHYER